MQVYGPPIHEVKSADALNTSQKLFFDILTGKLPDEQYENFSSPFADVRDIAEIHVRATEIDKAGGTRCLICTDTVYPQEIRASACVSWLAYIRLTCPCQISSRHCKLD
jgi:hypothetical protein